MAAARRLLDRLARAWRALDPERRLAAGAALALVVSMFLPWYEKSAIPPGGRQFVTTRISAFGAVSFVEGAVLVVALGVLALAFLRAEGRAFHLPGGDGTVVLGAGLWAAVLIVYRVFDKPTADGGAATVGIGWGVFVAFLAAALLAASGARLRAARRPEAPLPPESEEEAPTVRQRRPAASHGALSRDEGRPGPSARRDDDRPGPPARRDEERPPGQMSFDEAETQALRAETGEGR